MMLKKSLQLRRVISFAHIWQAFSLVITLTLVQGVFYKADAHSGGTNASGCHAGTKPYHCHGGGSSGGGSSSFSSPPARNFYTNPGFYMPSSSIDSATNNKAKDSLCPKFYFSELLRQGENGNVYIKCNNAVIVIREN